MKLIKLTAGFSTMVDDEDYEFLMQHRWQHINTRNNGKYASHGIYIDGRVYRILMHRLIMLAPNDVCEIDHIDGDGLNNQKYNLRFATDKQNGRNKGLASNNTSGYKGVSWHKGINKWGVSICYKGNDRSKHLGYFKDIKDAARAYNKAATKYHGEFARLNVIPE